jgi:dethiobiotin synthetase
VRTVFVTGTDTGVGKTFVAARLARSFRSAGATVVAVKPIETGTAILPGTDEDGMVLASATLQPRPTAALVRLRAPVTPALAAEQESMTLDPVALAAAVRSEGVGADVLLVEGAGGALSPLTWETDFTDLARAVDPAGAWIVVARDRLGVLHQVRATVEALAARAIVPRAIVLGGPEVGDASTGHNARALTRVLPEVLRERVLELPFEGGGAMERGPSADVADAIEELRRLLLQPCQIT